jgi:hypothetical protein
MTVRNLSREPVMGFRLGSLFRFNRMLNSPSSANPYVFDSGFKTMDFAKFGSMYDTSAGVGITGSMVPNVEKRGRSLWWLVIPAVGFVLFWFNFMKIAHGFQHLVTGSLNKMVPGMQVRMAGAMNIPSNSIAGALYGTGWTNSIPAMSGQAAAVSGVAAVTQERNVRQVVVEKPKIWPDWNLQGETNLLVTGMAVAWIPGRVLEYRIYLSNGCELPIEDVLKVSQFCVTLKTGERIRVANWKDYEALLSKFGSQGVDDSQPAIPAAVMSLNAAGAGHP